MGVFHFLGSVPGTSDSHRGLTNCTPLVPGTRCARSKIYPQLEMHLYNMPQLYTIFAVITNCFLIGRHTHAR